MATSQKRKTKKKPTKRQEQVQALPLTDPEEPSDEGLKRDFLDDFLFHAADYVYRKRKLFISLAVFVAAVVIVGYSSYRYIQYTINQRNEQLYAIEKIIQNREIADAQRFEASLPLLNSFIEAHPDTNQQNIALFYRSRLYFDQKKYTEAETDLKKLLSSLEKESDLFVLASLYLSNVLVDQQKADQAIEILENARTEYMTDIILMALSEIYLNTLQKDKAKQTLEILMTDYPNSMYNQRAKQLLNLLR